MFHVYPAAGWWKFSQAFYFLILVWVFRVQAAFNVYKITTAENSFEFLSKSQTVETVCVCGLKLFKRFL